MRVLVTIFVVLFLAAAGVYVAAGRMAGPAITIVQPSRYIGRTTPLDVTIETPGGRLSALEVRLEQAGRQIPIASLADGTAELRQEAPDRVRLAREIGGRALPALREGSARLVVRAARPVLFGLRTVASAAERALEVRLTPPRLSVLSTHHHIAHGGSELVVYRVTPPDAASGVRVGEIEYPGFPASGAAPLAGVSIADPSIKVAFFALLHDQDLQTPMALYARDEAGNTARAEFEHRVFPRPFRRSRIELGDGFLGRVVPAILEQTPDFRAEGDLLARFLAINGELRRRNAEQIQKIGSRTADRALWSGPFQQLASSQVESAFADHRTYVYQGREVDQQVHLGFDLAVTANVAVRAANGGTVLYADYLGIYGNCVILDHGLGVQSLYGHLSSIGVEPGRQVAKGDVLGRSGMTGLAGGDHLHFTMLLHGRPVNPVEWWDPHWIEDRILRKLREAAAPAVTSAAP
ncbi:MAG TPA: M23 family metallopeptidase [Vicinamibacterales bacterium]|nr:M23 family metallopeptidase [Vicinamibacterales bacterium]